MGVRHYREKQPQCVAWYYTGFKSLKLEEWLGLAFVAWIPTRPDPLPRYYLKIQYRMGGARYEQIVYPGDYIRQLDVGQFRVVNGAEFEAKWEHDLTEWN